jgi:hypothetical protein
LLPRASLAAAPYASDRAHFHNLVAGGNPSEGRCWMEAFRFVSSRGFFVTIADVAAAAQAAATELADAKVRADATAFATPAERTAWVQAQSDAYLAAGKQVGLTISQSVADREMGLAGPWT